MTDAYIIQRYVWDIDYSSRDKAYALQTRFSRLFDASAIPIMETVFEDCVPAHRLVRLETLELDLGVLPADLIERDFPERFKTALEKALMEHLGLLPGGRLPERSARLPQPPVSPDGARPDSVSPTAHSAELLEYFLLEGTLPWWAARHAEEEPQRLLERLYEEAPGHLAPLLLRAGQLPYVRRRLAYQFPDTGLRAAVSLIAPGEGAFISAYHATVVRAQQETRWVPQEAIVFSRELWLFILTFLLKDMAGYFNRRAFVRQTLMDMARHYNVAYPSLLALLSDALRTTAARFQDQDALQKIIRDLNEQWEDKHQDPTPDIFQEDVSDLEAKLAGLRHYLLGHTPPEGFNLPLLLSALSTRLPSTLRNTLSDLGRAETVRERVSETFGDFGLQLVVRLEEPTHAAFIFDYTAQIQTVHRFQADAGSFRKVVWTLILGYLWNERGSIFNTRMFLERQIRGLAQHYRMDYGGLLSLLVGDPAPELHGPAKDWAALEPSSLFRLLLDIWKEYEHSDSAREQALSNDGASGTARAPSAGHASDFARALGIGPEAADAGVSGDAGVPRDAGVSGATGVSNAGIALPPNPGEASNLYRALLHLLRGLTAPDILLPEAASAMAEWERALPILRTIGGREQGVLPSWWEAGRAFDAAHFLEETLRWLSAQTGLKTGALARGLALATRPDTSAEESTAARTLRYLLLAAPGVGDTGSPGEAPGADGANGSGQVPGLSPGVSRVITAWLSTPRGRESADVQPDPRLEAALQTWMEKRQPGWDKRTLAFMKDLRRLFLSVLQTTVERDDFEALFLECSLLFLGDRYGAKDPQAFSLALLSYMEGRRKTSPALYMALLKASGPPHRYSLDGTPFFPGFRALLRRRLPAGVEEGGASGGGGIAADTSGASGTAADTSARDGSAGGASATTDASALAQRATPPAQSAPATDRQRIALELAEARRREDTRKRERRPGSGLYVHNAGLVLLHPLLATLFNRLQWLDKGQFKGEAVQQRAVHLLQFLVYGAEKETETPEQDLVLNKLLCGLSLEDPVPLESVLTEGEMSLGEELLRVVLQQWPKLGNTTIWGLRLTFLQRGGSLTETPEGWTLRVEQKGVDVLLPFLPWGWGMIKPTWMQKTLHVEWT